MKDKPTPETDALASEHRGAVIWPDFARRLESERDAALLGYNECRATIEDARIALKAHKHEGLLLSALRIHEELVSERALADRLAKALLSFCSSGMVWPNTDTPEKAITAWKEARSD